MKQLLGRSPDISGTKNGEQLLPGSSKEDTVGYNKQHPQQHGWSNRVCTEMNVRNCYSQDYLQNKHNAYGIQDIDSVLPEIQLSSFIPL